MKFWGKIASLCLICCMALTFGGCSFWFGSDIGGGNGGGSGTDTSGPSRPPLPVEDEPTPPEEIDITATFLQDQARAVQGVRSTYVPGVDEVASDPVLRADRSKYLRNAAYQYEIVARYILHTLQGTYGEGVGSSTITYNFYADTNLTGTFYEGKEIRNPEDPEKTVITLPAITPEDEHTYPKTLGTHRNAINDPVVNVKLDPTVLDNPKGETACPPAYAVHASELGMDLKWNMSGEDIISTYLSIVQLNLMEYALGEPLSPQSIGASAAQTKINELAKKIDKLGIPQGKYYYDFLIDYITETIIGTPLMDRELASLSYTDPSYKYYLWEIVGYHVEGTPPNEHTVPDYDWVEYTGWYEMLGSGTPHSFSNDEIYKFGYQDTAEAIATAILGTFDGERHVDTGFTFDFPTYTRVEITDSQAYNFYYSHDDSLDEVEEGEERDPQKISSMDYRDYNSVIIYPNAEAYTEEEFGVAIDEEKRNWLINYANIYIDSVMDITIDIYLRVYIAPKYLDDGTLQYGREIIVHLTRMNTDSTRDYTFSPDEDEETRDPDYHDKYYDEEGNIKREYLFDENKTNNRLVSLETACADADIYNIIKAPLPNKYTTDDPTADTFRQYFHLPQEFDEEDKAIPPEDGTQTYHNVFAGKLGSNLSIDTFRHLETNKTFDNYYGDTVDLGDKYLCQEDCNFIEFIFDVQKDPENGPDYDYSFKFSILPLYMVSLEDIDFSDMWQ